MKFGLFYLPSIGLHEEIENGMAGQNPVLYQRMLKELAEQARLADDTGYESIGFTEHHFHVEGYEISNNPVMLDLFIGLHTKRIKVGQLGIVLPAASPLRVAEDIAMLDHMTGGRAYVGFARGYQKRAVNVLGQQYHVSASASDQSEVDRVNREAYEEFFRIIKLSWTHDVFSFRGKYWQIPPAEGIPWSHNATARVGKGQEEDGVVRRIGIAPRCLQKPYPRIYQPFSFSPETIRWCAHEDIMPIVLYTDLEKVKKLFKLYQDEAAAAGPNHDYVQPADAHLSASPMISPKWTHAQGGRKLAFGENIGLFRDCVVAATDEEAKALAAKANGYVWPEWFAPFGFNEALRRVGETGPLTIRGDFNDLYERDFELVGSPDTVARKIERLQSELDCRYLLLWTYNGLIPHEKLMRSIDLFANKVMPRFAEREATQPPASVEAGSQVC
jgi:alkanesulfonate monooxygenase SsuD/methylene tetrahydromethanopterin reductase-like flavin-dependent oxidoreductase (luciferase family)